LNLTGSAVVFITAAAEDVFQGELFAENPSSPTAPSATGTNAVAIGTSAVASGLNAMAFGEGSTASGDESLALGDSGAVASNAVSIGPNAYAAGISSTSIGLNSDARSTGSTAIGYNSQAFTGSNATALTNSYASGADSFAAAIANNTSSYGATGANSVAIGREAKAVASDSLALGWASQTSGNGRSTAIGYLTHASDFGATALGYDNDASGSYSTAIGRSTNVSGDNSVGIGYQAGTSVNNQVVLGGTTQQVKISNTYTLPTSDGTNGQVLTTDGAGAVTFADAGGGSPDLYAENYDGTSTKPTAGGTNTVAIGKDATSSNSFTIALGQGANASGSGAGAFGRLSQATGGGSHAFGLQANASGTYATAIGRGSAVTATSVGTGSTAIGGAYASGTDSFAAAIANNTASYGATGANSVAIGKQNKSTGSYGVTVGGQSNVSSAFYSGCFNTNAGTSSQNYTTVINGYGTTADVAGKIAFGTQYSGWTRVPQTGLMTLFAATTDATATELLAQNSRVTLPNNSAYSFSGTIIARESAAAGSDYASWEIKGALLRDANAASTVLGNGIKNKLYASAGASAWDIALTADTTNGGLKIEVTGAASTNIRWVATVNTSEVTYA
jgi:hypothetical protein